MIGETVHFGPSTGLGLPVLMSQTTGGIMRKIEIFPVKSTLYTGEDSWQVRIWHNESQSSTFELSKSELESLHVQTTDAFMNAYGTITHSR